MTSFLLNPYDAVLDLADKEDRKLFQESCKGLPEKSLFDGQKHHYQDFVKLTEKELKKFE